MGKPCTVPLSTQKLIVEDYVAGMHYKKIAEKYGVTKRVVERTINRNKVEKRGPILKRVPLDKIDNLMELYRSGVKNQNLCKLFDCTEFIIRQTIKDNGGEIKKRGGQIKDNPEIIKQVVSLYEEGNTQTEIGDVCHISQSTVGRILKEWNPDFVELGRKWRSNGRIYNKSGYTLVRLLESDPYYSMVNSGGYVLEHRYVMAQSLGRVLKTEEQIHHIDGNRANNDITNLQLVQGAHGAGQKFVCCNCGSHNIKAIEI